MRSAPQGEVISLIKEGLQCDSLGKSLMGLTNDGKTKRFWVQDDLLCTVGNRLYVPKFGNLRKNLIKECHDTKWAGHPGEATHHSSFELATGQQPLTPQMVMVGYTGRSPGSYKLAKDWQEQADIARSYLDKAARKMKKWADKKRRRVEFQVGDLVLVKLLPQQFKAFRKVHKGFVRKYEGPFPILKKVGKVSYKVELPPRLKIHPVFHVSHLKPYHADMEDPSRGESSRAPTAVVTSYDKEVEEILADRVVRKRGVPRSSEYLIKWKGLPTSEATWEPKELLFFFLYFFRYRDRRRDLWSRHQVAMLTGVRAPPSSRARLGRARDRVALCQILTISSLAVHRDLWSRWLVAMLTARFCHFHRERAIATCGRDALWSSFQFFFSFFHYSIWSAGNHKFFFSCAKAMNNRSHLLLLNGIPPFRIIQLAALEGYRMPILH
ncbi:hypothetical protein ACOSQ2_027788 [Xanthoceras sorbifolium]